MVAPRIILDTNLLASAFTSGRGASREVLRRVLRRGPQALISVPLFMEYEAVLARPQVQRRCRLSLREQGMLLDAFLVLELAVAARGATILAFNRRMPRTATCCARRAVSRPPGCSCSTSSIGRRGVLRFNRLVQP